MNKRATRALLQVGLCVAVIILGLTLLQAVVNNIYFYPSNSFAQILPEFSNMLINIWGVGLMIVLVIQSVLLLVIGVAFMLANWLKLRQGKGTRRAQIIWSSVVIGLSWIVVLLLFGAVSLTGGATIARWLILLIVLVMGVAQMVITITCKLGPHYESLKSLDD